MAWSEADVLDANPVAVNRLLTIAGTAEVLTDIGPVYARDLNIIDAIAAMSGRVLVEDVRKLPRAQDFGAVCDGSSRPISQWFVGGARDRGYANLAAVQVDFPHVTSSSDEIDWAAAQAALNAYNSVGLFGTVRTNKSLDLSGTPKIIGGLGKNASTLITSSVNLPFITISGVGLGHIIRGIGGVFETLQTISNTNSCLVAAALDASVSEKIVEHLILHDVRLQDGYAILGVLSTAPGSNPISISSAVISELFTDNCCKVIDWVTNSRVGYFTRSWISLIQAYNSRAGTNGYIFDLSKINRLAISNVSTDRQLDNGRILRCDTGVSLGLTDISAADLTVTDANPLILVGATEVAINKLYVNIGTHASASFAPNAVHPIVKSTNGRISLSNIAIKADQPTKLTNGTLALVASDVGGAEISGLDLDAFATLAATSSGTVVKLIDQVANPATARFSTIPQLLTNKIYNGDATGLTSPLVITEWGLATVNTYIFKTTLSSAFEFILPANTFIDGQTFTVVRQAAGAGVITVKVGSTILDTLTTSGETKKFVASATALNGWYVD